MKILLLINSLMFYRAGSHSNQTSCINKDAAVKKLKDSISVFQTISDEMSGKTTNDFNNALCFSSNDFKGMKNVVFLTGEISKKYLNVNFWIENLDQLENFNQDIVSSSAVEKNIKFKFTSMVISLINNIFQSSTLPKEDIEISSNEKSNLLKNITNLLSKNQNQVTISVIHNETQVVIFKCFFNENCHNELQEAAFCTDLHEAAHNPNESQEHEGAALLDKKRQDKKRQ